jgi:hypothetical protein
MKILNDEFRARVRAVLEAAGCEVIGIDPSRNAVQVRLVRNGTGRFLAAVKGLGATFEQEHYSAIGSEEVADDFRHDGPTEGSRAYTFNVLVCLPSSGDCETSAGSEFPEHFPVGTVFRPRSKPARLCTVTDRLTTTNLAGEVVAVHYVATHEFLGQVVTDHDVLRTTIARGLISMPTAVAAS